MFARTRSLLRSGLRPNPELLRLPVAPAASRRAVARFTPILVAASAAAAGLGLVLCDEDRLDRWRDRWATGRVAWHREKPNEILVTFYDEFMGSHEGSARVLAPLCGKSVDMPYLAQRGNEVVGVDGVEAAAWQLQRDSWLKFEVSQRQPSVTGTKNRPTFIAAPTFEKRRSGYVFKTDAMGTGYYIDAKAIKCFQDSRRRISVVVTDFLHLSSGDIGTFDRIWDRGALVALRPEDREDYVRVCDTVLAPGGKILLATLVYDQAAKKGPPFSIPLAEVQRLYGGQLGYKVEMLRSVDARKDYQGGSWDELHKKSGLHECVFLLTKPGASRPGWFARVILRRKFEQ